MFPQAAVTQTGAPINSKDVLLIGAISWWLTSCSFAVHPYRVDLPYIHWSQLSKAKLYVY
jgi:hypothetical protein